MEYSGLSSIQKGDNSDFTSTKTIADFTFWDELKGQIDGMLQRDGDVNEVGSLSMINRDAGLITVSGSFKQLKRVEKYINDLQTRMHKQLLLEVRILEVSFSEKQQEGIDWSKFNLSLSGTAGASYSGGTDVVNRSGDLYSAGFNFSMEGLMDFLKKQGEVEVLSSPKVMTLNNQPALINVGDQINYKYETGEVGTIGIGTPSSSKTFSLGSVFVGLSLSIIPEITDDGFIILRINPVDSRIIDDENEEDPSELATSDIRSIPPDMKIKQMTSIVKVKDGNKVLIGGLVQKENFVIDNKIPILGDIPYLGRLFHSTITKKVKKEFFIVVVPTIITEGRIPSIEENYIINRTENFLLYEDDNKTKKGAEGV
ncbi:MAG TPA: pilus (MSHA type) biogenesis protein MshL [Sulfurimonas sp.]|nr:pilus (MSHA type) biogenesis protein MshL [Sulfurimonas sp.]